MKKIILLLTLGILVILNSCDVFETGEDGSLTTEEVVNGLKKALEIGTDSAVNILHVNNGYYADQAVKILLPEEAQVIYTTANKLDNYLPAGFNLNNQIEKVVKGINKAAESAAGDAKDIFVNAIFGMSISDGWKILNGTNPLNNNSSVEFDSLAATQYFKAVTFTSLVELFSNPIDTELDKDLGLGFSANQAWNTLVTNYNLGVNSYNIVAGLPFSGLTPLYPLPDDLSLGEHCTQAALNGLFLKVGDEEKKIRKDPFQWAIDIIQKVFGSVL